ncbi:ABC transporter ATP-binding protein/permease [Paracidovorax valerianellae]|uniref:Putative ATP-binding cassette transporter n=1 Tax=Paracidovorax valerianellae TaxID=187868 RepID=A0A1G7A2D2_9BURK|nr:ABC transporter ATP-binding protein/permease [Paracidovorax valerianellae]MDA8443772.1 ABC transporter ATP-binding protein/permease [Paracidovorax valerianellae]SDE08901.1 putative ATP-binding cassette transporter [Paracidovorax valerianellae]
MPHPTAAKTSSWSLIRPYWFSQERWSARGLLALIVAMNLGIVHINVRINAWSADFFNALEARNTAEFGPLLMLFTGLALAYIVLAVYALYFKQMLGFRWRRWLTTEYLQRWLHGNAFYRIERDRLADNPDQRIAEDLNSLATTTLALTLDLLSTVVTLGSFIFILWSVGGPLLVHVAGYSATIPGYMVWAAAAYALVGSVAMQAFGHRLVAVNYRQQQVEAHFRFGLVRLRENAEPIALYDGARAEAAHSATLFGRIQDNWRLVMRYTKRLTLVNSLYSQIAVVLPLALAAPRYFAGAYSFGVLMQISRAFDTVSGAMSWFINSYGTLAEWRATVNRLTELGDVLASVPASTARGIRLQTGDGTALATHGLQLALPGGGVLLTVPDLRIAPGERWLLRGPSGAGKSTLLRALAGLWDFGSGTVGRPKAKTLFVPQRSYLPLGSLGDALAYPDTPGEHTEAQVREALEAVGLQSFGDQLGDVAPWAQRLSPGEQQRLAFARVLLQKPEWLLLDEATSALDPAAERLLYTLLADRLPATAVISVGHRDALADFHAQQLVLGQAEASPTHAPPEGSGSAAAGLAQPA